MALDCTCSRYHCRSSIPSLRRWLSPAKLCRRLVAQPWLLGHRARNSEYQLSRHSVLLAQWPGNLEYQPELLSPRPTGPRDRDLYGQASLLGSISIDSDSSQIGTGCEHRFCVRCPLKIIVYNEIPIKDSVCLLDHWHQLPRPASSRVAHQQSQRCSWFR